MDAIVTWFAQSLGEHISKEGVVFIISMLPILELRGGLLAAKLLELPLLKAIPICIVGNIIPIPFILLLIKRFINWTKTTKHLAPFGNWLEKKAEKRSDKIENYEFMGLMLFVGIPLPGTGAWTGSLIASLLEIDFKKSLIAELCGIAIATVIMSVVSYGLLGIIIG
ncbi:MAG: small multi-drug export protein [Eubacterium sp.]|nr:small multi-drug export protein [Eubacterium sp.]